MNTIMKQEEIRGVKIGDQFKTGKHTAAEVVDFYEQRSLTTGELINILCMAKPLGALCIGIFETSFSRVIRFKI